MDAGSALDTEHQGQIDLLLKVENELRGAANPDRLASLLDHLIEFTDIHFMSEQVLMREAAHEVSSSRCGAFISVLRRASKYSVPPTCPACAAGCFATSKPRMPAISVRTPEGPAVRRCSKCFGGVVLFNPRSGEGPGAMEQQCSAMVPEWA